MKLSRETQRLLQEAGELVIDGRLYTAIPPDASHPEPPAVPEPETAPEEAKEGE